MEHSRRIADENSRVCALYSFLVDLRRQILLVKGVSGTAAAHIVVQSFNETALGHACTKVLQQKPSQHVFLRLNIQ